MQPKKVLPIIGLGALVSAAVAGLFVMWTLHARKRRDLARRKRLEKMLPVVAECFNRCGVHYWVDYGTLLGLVREKRVIIGDNDLDFCVWDTPDNHDRLKHAAKELRSRGYRLAKEPTWDAYRVKPRNAPNLFADVYLARPDPTNPANVLIASKWDSPAHLLQSFAPIDVMTTAIQVPAPADLHTTLKQRYGHDYMTPRRGYKGPNYKPPLKEQLASLLGL